MNLANDNITIKIDPVSAFKFLLMVLLFVLLYVIRDVIVIVLFSVVIASGINPIVNRMQKRGIPRAFSVFLVYIALLLALAVFLFFIIKPLSNEISNLSETLPLYVDRLSLEFEQVRTSSPQYEELLGNVQTYLSGASESLKSFATNIFAALSKIFGGVTTALIVIIISFYLAAEERGIPMFLRAITPIKHQSYILNLWVRAQNKIGRWLRGQIILSISVGVLVFIGLSIFGIRFKVILALFAAVMEIVPFIGPIIAAIPAVFLALLKSPIVALWTVLVYVVVQQLENTILVPKIMQHAVGLNPVVIIISLLIGGKLFGIAGLILAVPVAAVIVEIIGDFGDGRDKKAIRP